MVYQRRKHHIRRESQNEKQIKGDGLSVSYLQLRRVCDPDAAVRLSVLLPDHQLHQRQRFKRQRGHQPDPQGNASEELCGGIQAERSSHGGAADPSDLSHVPAVFRQRNHGGIGERIITYHY